MLQSVLTSRHVETDIEDMNASDPVRAEQLRFPGSPTIRVNGEDVEPNFVDSGDYWPRCRLYPTEAGLAGLPEREWVERAIDAALSS